MILLPENSTSIFKPTKEDGHIKRIGFIGRSNEQSKKDIDGIFNSIKSSEEWKDVWSRVKTEPKTIIRSVLFQNVEEVNRKQKEAKPKKPKKLKKTIDISKIQFSKEESAILGETFIRSKYKGARLRTQMLRDAQKKLDESRQKLQKQLEASFADSFLRRDENDRGIKFD